MYPKIIIEEAENGWVVTREYPTYLSGLQRYIFSSEKDALDFVVNSIRELTEQVNND